MARSKHQFEKCNDGRPKPKRSQRVLRTAIIASEGWKPKIFNSSGTKKLLIK